MALTATLIDLTGNSTVQREANGGAFEGDAEIVLDTAYPTNGYDLTVLAGLLGWNQVRTIRPYAIGPSLSSGVLNFSFDKANKKLKLYDATGTEVTNNTDVHTFKVYATVRGS